MLPSTATQNSKANKRTTVTAFIVDNAYKLKVIFSETGKYYKV